MTALLDEDYLEARMSPSTLTSIFDDANDGTRNTDAIDVCIEDAEAEVYSWVSRNYPNLTIPVAAADPPPTLRLAAFGFFYVFARDRKPEYWSKAQETERKDRLKAAYELVERYAKAEQILYDTDGAPPANVGGVVSQAAVDPNDPCRRRFFADGTGDF